MKSSAKDKSLSLSTKEFCFENQLTIYHNMSTEWEIYTRSLFLGDTRRPLMVWPPLKYTWTPCFPQTFSNIHSVLECMGQQCESFFLKPDVVLFCWLSLWLLLLFPGLGWCLFLNFILFSAHMGYMLFITTSNAFALEVIVVGLNIKLRLCGRVLMTLYLANIMWWLSNWRDKNQCRWVSVYWVSKVPSYCGITSASSIILVMAALPSVCGYVSAE